MDNANLLLNIGKKMYEKSKNFVFFLPAGCLCLLLTLIFAGEYALDYLAFAGYYPIVNVLMAGWYLLILIGSFALPVFFVGLILIGLGQIAKNTCAPEVTTAPASADMWVCKHCNTQNSLNYSQCKKCGNYK